MHGCILRALLKSENTLFFKLQTKAVHGCNLTNLWNVFHRTHVHVFFIIAQIGPCFQGPTLYYTVIMIRLGSLWYNCIY